MRQKICVLGCGVVGEIFLSFLKEQTKKYEVFGIDLSKKNIYGLPVLTDLKIIKKADIVILAIKPNDFLYSNFEFKNEVLIISVMAGTKIKLLQKKCKTKRIIRVMPNTPAKIGLGVIGWIASKEVSTSERKFAKNLFQKMGKEIYLSSEDKINKITAVSGSGPAFVYKLVADYYNAARKLGLDKKAAEIAVYQTFKGSLELLTKDFDPEGQIKKVAKPGGTTETGLKELKIA